MNLEDEYRSRAPETLEACSTPEVHRRVNPFAQPVQVLRAGSSLRSKAEAYLEKARRVSDRQRARLLLVQAHNFLKRAEETEAEQLSAR